MKRNLQLKTALNQIKSQLNTGVWAMSGKDLYSFNARIESLLKDFGDYGDTMPEEPGDDEQNDNDFDGDNTDTPEFAMVKVAGEIVYNAGIPEELADMIGVCDLANVYSELLAIKDDKTVSTMVLALCSPGGTTAQLDETYQLIKQIGETKNVVAFATGILASAAYELACAADDIYVTPSCVVGAVGAKYTRLDISQQLASEGIKVHAIASSPKKYWGDPKVAPSAEELAYWQSQVNQDADAFAKKVLTNRNVDKSLLDGSFFNGVEAVKNGFADNNINSLYELKEKMKKSKV